MDKRRIVMAQIQVALGENKVESFLKTLVSIQPYQKNVGFHELLLHANTTQMQVKDLASSLLQLEIDKLKSEAAVRAIASSEDKMEDLVCPLCKSLFTEPTTLKCGHTFCKLCVDDDIFNSRNCITCGSALTKEGKASTFQLCNIISKCLPKHLESGVQICKAKKLMDAGKYDKALEYLMAIQCSDTLYGNWYRYRADCFMALGRLHLALRDIEMAAEFCPMSVSILYRKARILLSVSQYQKGVSVLVRCAALEPECAELRSNLESTLEKLLRVDYLTDKGFASKNLDLMRDTENGDKLVEFVGVEEKGKSESTLRRYGKFLSSSLFDSKIKSSFEFPSMNVREEFDCRLCCNLLFKPVTSPCGHTFCGDCLQRSLDFRVECPCCRTQLTKYLAERRNNVTHVIESMIQKLFPNEYKSRKRAYEKEFEEMKRAGECTEFEIPTFVCTIGFPSLPCPLHIFEPRYKLMIRRCLESGSRQFGMCAPSNDSEAPFATTGTMLKIIDVAYLPDGRSLINTKATRRFKVLSHSMKDGYIVAKVRWLVDEIEDSEQEKLEIQRLNHDGFRLLQFWYQHLTSHQKECIFNAVGEIPQPEDLTTTTNNKPDWLWWALAALPLTDQPKMIILSMTSVIERLRSIRRFLMIMIKMQQQSAAERDQS